MTNNGIPIMDDTMQRTNADRIRAMTDMELAIFLRQTQEDVILAGGVYPDWPELLKKEAYDPVS